MIEAVLWDVDDTIFDFTGSERTGLLRHFEAEGLPSDQGAWTAGTRSPGSDTGASRPAW
ncbi:hypothetical protein OG979_31220 [Actinomadura citrea]|uniref:hypothetical protein n=1 Tax=Actinomadura citrea TaxID=46158 RepID=UPI002E297FA2|nr:hypothetical protein [Actinomadura citrea]